MASITVEAVALTKRFGDRSAVDAVSFGAAPGDVLGVLGPNGAGKTTLIRLLTTVLTPTSGEFRVAGQPSTAATEIRRRIGVLPESSGYPGHQTGREYLRYHARLYGLSGSVARRVADDLLVEVGLEERAGSRISSYSRGMRQRLGIARALVNNPTVVFLDEPTLGLDPAGQSKVLDLVRDIAKGRGATVVLSTHTLPEVELVCSRVLVLDRGKVLISGTVSEVIDAAVVERYAQLRVPIDLVERARVALAGISGLTVDQLEGRPDVLRIAVRGPSSSRSVEAGERMNAAIVAVARANVSVLSYEVEGARLSDAFLKLTSDAVK
jgi:ABC-2 type transport system ATP-binding protein